MVVRLLDVGAQAALQSATLVFFVYFGIELTSGLVLLLDNRVTCDGRRLTLSSRCRFSRLRMPRGVDTSTHGLVG